MYSHSYMHTYKLTYLHTHKLAYMNTFINICVHILTYMYMSEKISQILVIRST